MPGPIVTSVSTLTLLGQPIRGLIAIKSGGKLLALAKATDTGFTTKGIKAQTNIKLDSRQRAHVTRMVKQNRITPAPKPDITTNPLYTNCVKRAQAAAAMR